DVSGNQILDNTITSSGAENTVGIEVGTILGNSEDDPDRTDPVLIAALMAAGAVHDNLVQGNDIDGADTGVYFYNVTDLTVAQNEIANCIVNGIYVEHGHSGVVVNYNSICGNACGLEHDDTDVDYGSIDARYNWWGDAAGPEITTNPYDAHNAEADSVTTNVDYIPWMIHTELDSGWNVYSTPIAPDTATDTIGKALDLWTVEGSGNLGLAYYYGYDSKEETQAWISANADTALTPLQAVYLNMTAAATIDVVFSTSYSEIPSKTMYADWNLIGLAELYDMGAEGALASAYYVAGANNIGYSQVVSPATGQTGWINSRGAAIDTSIGSEKMLPCLGYWVYMINSGGTLAG
ncbi:MAG: right-handed parallel beta-helix repeat-containing protein, partial [Dehalococcoidia bacterium]|nr:right-handed parallel beta-helix repeat-containing protein [Dehalococcoidia bacterium]